MSDTRRPNLVLITADQWRGDCLSGTGSPHPVMTPHVTQIGCEGARFVNAYADCPVCQPQRVTQLTGQVASRFGLTHNFGGKAQTPVDPLRSLPGRLVREAGYQAQAVGKMHFEPPRARLGFEHIRLHPNDYAMWLEENGMGGMYRGHGLGGNEVYPAVSAVPERFTHTHWVIDEAIRFLYQREPDVPFFLWLVFEAPHSPFDPPEPYDRMYDNFTIPDPVRGDWADEAYPPAFAKRVAMAKYDHLTPEMIREARRKYYGQVSHIDYQLGRFFGELMTRGLYGNTAICFTADHGEHLGDHGLFAKTTFLRGSGDVPLLLRLPATHPPARPDLVVRTPALTADICPTFLELAGLTPDADCDGASLLPALREGRTDDDRRIHGECGGTAFCTDGRFKYLYYEEGGIEQLFDLRSDPDEKTDLSARPDLADTRDALRNSLVEYLLRYNRPMAAGGVLRTVNGEFDEHRIRGMNPYAYRGPMRYGMGYYGHSG